MTARKTKVAAGPKCKNQSCGEPIRKSGDRLAPWVHVATGNVFCRTNVQGHTAKFAEPS